MYLDKAEDFLKKELQERGRQKRRMQYDSESGRYKSKKKRTKRTSSRKKRKNKRYRKSSQGKRTKKKRKRKNKRSTKHKRRQKKKKKWKKRHEGKSMSDDISRLIVNEKQKVQKLFQSREPKDVPQEVVEGMQSTSDRIDRIQEALREAKEDVDDDRRVNQLEGCIQIGDALLEGLEKGIISSREFIGLSENLSTVTEKAVEGIYDNKTLSEMIEDPQKTADDLDWDESDTRNVEPMMPYIKNMENNSELAKELGESLEGQSDLKDKLEQFAEDCQVYIEEAKNGHIDEKSLATASLKSSKAIASALEEAQNDEV